MSTTSATRAVDITKVPRWQRRRWFVEKWVGDEMHIGYFRTRWGARRWAKR